ncbi:MAG: hypothetical protein ABI175_22365, partial [Polyangiales bacterium]
MHRVATGALLVTIAAFVAGCHGEEVGAAPTSDGGGDVSTYEIGGDGALRDTASPPLEAGTCVNNERGPDLASVGAFCIDVTEVTNAQYNAFIDAAVEPNSVSRTPEHCAFNTTFGTKVNEAATLDAPRVNV